MPSPRIQAPARAIAAAVLLVVSASGARAQAPAAAAVNAGLHALQGGETEKAATIMREALVRYPRDAQVLLGSGVVAQVQGRDRDAIALLTQALEIDPRLGVAAAILGELVYRQGEVDRAIQLYERALPDAPAAVAASMRLRLDAWKQEAALPQNHEALKHDRFSISFDGPVQQELAARALRVLDEAFWRIGGTLGAHPSAAINVILYSEQQFHDITGAPEWSAGGFDGQIRIPVGGAAHDLAAFDRVLVHELTHAMLKSVATTRLPAWLNEGLAMYCEGRDAAPSERRLAAAHLFVPLAALRTSFARLSTAQAVVAYDESAFATRALIDRIGLPGLAQLLQSLDNGQAIEQAVERFGFRFTAFESDLERRVGAGPRSSGAR
jgi:tetratricopeptide (TPR) repeat protein